MAALFTASLRLLPTSQLVVAAQGRRVLSVAAGSVLQARKRHVNEIYAPGVPKTPCPEVPATCSRGGACVCDSKTQADIFNYHTTHEWSNDDLKTAFKENCLMTWGANHVAKDAAIWVTGGDGPYLITNTGKRILDWNSQAMCSNLGHTVDPTIIDAVVKQMQTISYVYPGVFNTDIKVKLSKLLADMVPGDINHFIFPSGGAEANETMLRCVRRMTGRHKVLSKNRSYHGGTAATMSLTGDFRRLPAEAGQSGYVKFFDPNPYSFSWGKTEEEICSNALTYTEEVVNYEGGHTIAAIIVEAITGTNGVLKPPKGYLTGLRKICDKHGILLVCDEVMAGFGRSGKMFAWCHEPGFVPDLTTFAKGLTSAYMPLGGVGVRDHVAKFFHENPTTIGSTYNSHPTAAACAYANLLVLLRDKVVQNAAANEVHMKAGMDMLLAKHPSVKQARVIGMFGCFDLQKNMAGDFIAQVHEPPTPAFLKFKKALLNAGLFTMMRGHNVFCNPPLNSTPEVIAEGFRILDENLHIMDDAMEK